MLPVILKSYFGWYIYVLAIFFFYNNLIKTRRGSPVDDRPSTDKLHHFVQKKE